MTSSIFSKLTNNRRHLDFLTTLDLQENMIDPGRKASSVGAMAAMGLGFRVEHPVSGVMAGISGAELVKLAGADTPLKAVLFECKDQGGYASVLPVQEKEISGLPKAHKVFSFSLKAASSEPAKAGTPIKPAKTIHDEPARKKRGRPKKDAVGTKQESPKNEKKTGAPAAEKKKSGVAASTKKAAAGAKKKTGKPEPKRGRGRPKKEEVKRSRGRPKKAQEVKRGRGRPPKTVKSLTKAKKGGAGTAKKSAGGKNSRKAARK